MIGYHFLRRDMTASQGKEPPWTVGEERVYKGRLVLCQSGYHWAPSWWDALQNAPNDGVQACLVEVDESEAVERDGSLKGVSRRRKLVAVRDARGALRSWAIECVERCFAREREAGREPNARSVAAIDVAKRFQQGQATQEEMSAAADSAWAAAYSAWAAADSAWAAAYSAWAAAYSAWAAAYSAWAAADSAWAAAYSDRAAEVSWQKQRLAQLLDPLFGEVLGIVGGEEAADGCAHIPTGRAAGGVGDG